MSHRLPTGLDAGGGTFSLRYQFAKDGDCDSQVAVAKILLKEESDSNERRFENANLAIHWLLRAAGGGHPEAFRLLRQCYKSGFGITPINQPSVLACLTLSKEDIIACKVGHRVYRSTMNDIEGEDGVSEENFAEKVELLLSQGEKDGDLNDEECNKSSFDHTPPPSCEPTEECPIDDQRRVSVSDIVYSVKQCLEGNLPLVALKNVVQCEEYDKLFSWKYVNIVCNMLCRSLEVLISDLGSPVLPCMLLIGLLLCFIYNYYSKESFDFVANSYEVFCGSIFSLVIMLSCSCYIIILHFGYYSVSKWLDLIKLFEPTVRSDEVREKYMEKTLYPLLIFFSASLIFNILQPMHPIKFFSGELLLLSILLLVLIDRTIANGRYYVNISLALNGLLCLHKAHFLTGFHFWDFMNFDIRFVIFENYVIHMNWLSCITLPVVLPYLYFAMARGNQKKGWLQTLLPHLMCLTWMNLACEFVKLSDSVDVLIGIGFWIAVFLLAYVIGTLRSLILCAIAKAYYLTETLTYGVMLRFVFPAVVLNFYVSRWLVEKTKDIVNKTVAFILFLTLVVFLLKTSIPMNTTSETSDILTWNQYEKYCHRNAWYQSNAANVEIECLPLQGKMISFEGTITQIDMIQSQNSMLYVASLLPPLLSRWFTCIFGQEFCDLNAGHLTAFQKERCAFYQKMKINECHLHNWDSYQYRIIIEVTSRTSPEVIIVADHVCTPFIKKLKDGDSLHVIGVLNDGVGSASPEIILKEATCTTCYEYPKSCKTLSPSSSVDYKPSWHQVISFYLSPFVQYLH